MNQKIDEIIKDLTDSDSSFKENKKLREIISLMIDNKPEIKIDENFKYNLKMSLENNYKSKTTFSKGEILRLIFTFFGGAIAATSFIFAVLPNFEIKEKPAHLMPENELSEGLQDENVRMLMKGAMMEESNFAADISSESMIMSDELDYDMADSVPEISMMLDAVEQSDIKDYEIVYNLPNDFSLDNFSDTQILKALYLGKGDYNTFKTIELKDFEFKKKVDDVKQNLNEVSELRSSISSFKSDNPTKLQVDLLSYELVYLKEDSQNGDITFVPAISFEVDKKQDIPQYYKDNIIIKLIDLK